MKHKDLNKVDKCIMCDKKTPYTKDTPVDFRCFYVDCAGQLCGKCWEDIYKTKYE